MILDVQKPIHKKRDEKMRILTTLFEKFFRFIFSYRGAEDDWMAIEEGLCVLGDTPALVFAVFIRWFCHFVCTEGGQRERGLNLYLRFKKQTCTYGSMRSDIINPSQTIAML